MSKDQGKTKNLLKKKSQKIKLSPENYDYYLKHKQMPREDLEKIREFMKENLYRLDESIDKSSRKIQKYQSKLEKKSLEINKTVAQVNQQMAAFDLLGPAYEELMKLSQSNVQVSQRQDPASRWKAIIKDNPMAFNVDSKHESSADPDSIPTKVENLMNNLSDANEAAATNVNKMFEVYNDLLSNQVTEKDNEQILKEEYDESLMQLAILNGIIGSESEPKKNKEENKNLHSTLSSSSIFSKSLSKDEAKNENNPTHPVKKPKT